jgi:hypothetical protein
VRAIYSIIVALGIASTVSASVIEITDRDEWEAAVGEFTTIDFVMAPSGTPITDQYRHLGVNFSGHTFSHESSGLYPNDQWGLRGHLGAWVQFDTPQSWLAVEFPGLIRIDLYYQGELIYASDIFWIEITGRFAGVVSDRHFDMAYLHRKDAPGNIMNNAYIDDLHFGTFIPAPSALGMLVLAGVITRKRRRP